MTVLPELYDRALDRIAPVLDALEFKADAKLSYAMFQDALYWSDEVVSGPVNDEEELVLSYLLHYRTLVIIGKPDTAVEVLWNEAKARCPKWPGFLPERIAPTEELRKMYVEWSEAAYQSFVNGFGD